MRDSVRQNEIINRFFVLLSRFGLSYSSTTESTLMRVSAVLSDI